MWPPKCNLLFGCQWKSQDWLTWKIIITGYQPYPHQIPSLIASDEQKLYHHGDSVKDLPWDTSYGTECHWSMGSVRKWRYVEQDHYWIFLMSVFYFSLIWILALYKLNWQSILPPATGGGVPQCARSAKTSNWVWLISSGTCELICASQWPDCVSVSIAFLLYS